jgi:hypothetical protein
VYFQDVAFIPEKEGEEQYFDNFMVSRQHIIYLHMIKFNTVNSIKYGATNEKNPFLLVLCRTNILY